MSVRTTQAIRFKGRSYFSLTLAPELPLDGWMSRLDAWLERSPGFFNRNAVILDLRDLALDRTTLTDLLVGLRERAVRVLGVEGADPDWASAELPPFMPSGKDARANGSESSAGESENAHASEKPLRHEAGMATSSSPALSPRARKWSRQARSMSTARCAVARWRAPTEMRRRAFSAAASKPN